MTRIHQRAYLDPFWASIWDPFGQPESLPNRSIGDLERHCISNLNFEGCTGQGRTTSLVLDDGDSCEVDFWLDVEECKSNFSGVIEGRNTGPIQLSSARTGARLTSATAVVGMPSDRVRFITISVGVTEWVRRRAPTRRLSAWRHCKE